MVRAHFSRLEHIFLLIFQGIFLRTLFFPFFSHKSYLIQKTNYFLFFLDTLESKRSFDGENIFQTPLPAVKLFIQTFMVFSQLGTFFSVFLTKQKKQCSKVFTLFFFQYTKCACLNRFFHREMSK